MFDFGLGTSELLLIAMVALIVVGPKELPGLLRTIGRWVGKIKALAADFQSHLDDLTRETGVKEVKEKVEKDIGALSIEDLDREFAEIEKEMREQLAEGAKQPGGPKEADDENLVEEEERPLPETLDLDSEPGAANARKAAPGNDAEETGDAADASRNIPADTDDAASKKTAPGKVAAGEQA